jgi:ABC-type multidrug transport system ATPase subunit
MISVQGLTKDFGRFRALDELSFRVERGESVALWGGNGAGKSTAIRCLLGILPFRGEIAVDGIDVRRHGKAARGRMGYVPQELRLHDDFRCLDILGFFARLRRADVRRCPDALAGVGLAEHARKRVRELSGGMKQRLALAIALLDDPPVLLLDELTSGLDARARADFLQRRVGLKRDGRTILFTSHRSDEVEALADRVVLLEQGKLAGECGSAAFVERVTGRQVMKIHMAPASIAEAMRILTAAGVTAWPNGCGVHVEVAVRRKAEPIRRLTDAAIDIEDFELLGEATVERSREVRHGDR